MRKNESGKVIERDGRRYREESVPSALPIWAAAAVWILAALLFPMYSMLHLLLIAAASAAAAWIVSRIVPREKRLVELPFYEGNNDLDAMARRIADARDAILRARDSIADAKPESAAKMSEIAATCQKIQAAILESPDDLPRVRRFLNYYLPTTEKLVAKYAAAIRQDSDSENIAATAASIEGALSQVNDSFKKQLDALFEDDALDVSTDITVLETMLARDNLK